MTPTLSRIALSLCCIALVLLSCQLVRTQNALRASEARSANRQSLLLAEQKDNAFLVSYYTQQKNLNDGVTLMLLKNCRKNCRENHKK